MPICNLFPMDAASQGLRTRVKLRDMQSAGEEAQDWSLLDRVYYEREKWVRENHQRTNLPTEF